MNQTGTFGHNKDENREELLDTVHQDTDFMNQTSIQKMKDSGSLLKSRKGSIAKGL